MKKIINSEKYRIEVSNEHIVISLNTPQEDELYAVYLKTGDDRVIEKKPYQTTETFTFSIVPNGAYYFRVFVRKGEAQHVWSTSLFLLPQGVEVAGTDSLMDKIIADGDVDGNLSLILQDEYFDAKKAFRRVMDAVHRGLAWRNKEDFGQRLLQYLKDSVDFRKRRFALSCLVYASESEFLRENYLFVKESIAACGEGLDHEAAYIGGLLEYRVGNFHSAELLFQGIKKSPMLEYHQAPSRSYFYRWSPDGTRAEFGDFNLLRKCEGGGDGVVLMSCDYGYFAAYFQKSMDALLRKECSVHVHFVLPQGFDLNRISVSALGEIGVSYEFEPRNVSEELNIKTYYAASRYLVLDKIIQTYEKPVLISDIDIDFSPMDLKGLFHMLPADEIALVFGIRNLPWLSILAGFNLFGRNVAGGPFVAYLKSFLSYCFATGRDAWMLDQVALEVSYQNLSTIHKRKIRPMSEIKNFPLRQYGDVDRYRTVARQARLDLALSMSE
ncbi:hypothetical protein [Paraburkholderia lycopersici]|uniref:Uncharacterized protein n=1 Tax=Paraburkholderia lycopersici TaxID=416944 RepID=A0A1G6NI55_9BURK|nr:hypothetical protein [Paraburkholderia lycopersici]SDC67650.1 hypothetical protein SAMN05421548_10964 [Paraburkholderia lycopersici]